jgi:hypothetical protein
MHDCTEAVVAMMAESTLGKSEFVALIDGASLLRY